MEKGLKTIKIITVTLIVIVLAILAFLGFYIKKNNIWQNVVPELNYGMELDGIRELRYELDITEEEKSVYIDSEGNILGEVKEESTTTSDLGTDGVSLETTEETTEEGTETESEEAIENTISEEVQTESEEETQTEEVESVEDNKPNYATEVRTIKANEDSVKTIENFNKSKKIIQDRLKEESKYEYNIRLDSVTGEIVLEVPNNEDFISKVKSAVSTKGEFEIIDEQTGIILADRDDVKRFEPGVYETGNGYQVCLQITFNEEGTEKLKNMSNEYREVVNEAGEASITYVTASVDGQTLLTTYFGEEIANGVLQIPLGETTTDSGEITNISEEAERLAHILNGDIMPIAYALSSDTLMKSTITDQDINTTKIILLGVLVVCSIILTIKFKAKGYTASILAIGYVSLLVIALKYFGADISLTLNSMIAFIAIIVLNYVFMKKILLEYKNNSDRKEGFWKVVKNYYLTILPVCIMAIIFTLVSSTVISSIGAVLFWGLVLQFLYSCLTVYALRLF